MKIDKVFETPEGALHFQGELTPKEHEAAVTVGLNYLLRIGAIMELGKKQDEEKPDVYN